MKKILIAVALVFMSTAAFAQKFAHVNFQEVFQLMPEMEKVRTDFESIQKENEEILKNMFEEYQKKMSDYNAKASVWTPAVKESKEKELVEMESRIQETRQNMSQEMQTIQNNMMAPVQEKAMKTINEIAKKGGYIYVFDVSGLVYYDATQSVDLTPEVREALGIPAGRTLEALQKELQEKAQLEQK